MPDRLTLAASQLDRVLAFFPRIEGKASFLFAVDLGLIGTIAVGFPVREWVAAPGIFGSIAALILTFSVWRLLQAYAPHLDGPDRRSLIYFRDIAGLSEPDYDNQLRSVTEDNLAADFASQIWRNSEILRIKFDFVEAAFRATAIALLPWVGYLLTATLHTGSIPIFR